MTDVANPPIQQQEAAPSSDPAGSADGGVLSFVIEFVRGVAGVLRPYVATTTSTGWTVLGFGVVAWLVGSKLDWVELRAAAVAAALLFIGCALLTIGRTKVAVELTLDPHRVVAGQAAAGRVVITNIGKARLLPVTLEVPIGESSARFDLPSLRPGEPHEELFVVQTARRGIVAIGPASTVRGDPLGLFRRSVSWTGVERLFVHPVTVPLDTLGSGLIRDLEGQTTTDISMSDLAFHALREYVPGDDWRHIHWKSSARAGSTGTGATFMVKQYLDTRRSSLSVVIDADGASYASPDEFEIAMSAAASVVVRAIRDGIETTVVVADQLSSAQPGPATLDRFSEASLGVGPALDAQAGVAVRSSPDASIAVLVTGARSDFADLRRAASRFPVQVNVLGLRVDPTRPPGLSVSPAVTLIEVGHLGDLAAVVRGVVG